MPRRDLFNVTKAVWPVRRFVGVEMKSGIGNVVRRVMIFRILRIQFLKGISWGKVVIPVMD